MLLAQRMKSKETRTELTQIKILISVCALTVLLIRIIVPTLNIDSIALGLLVVAALPWFADLLDSAELPGGWKIAFKDLKQQQQEQGEQIRQLRFLIDNFLSEYQSKCLRAMRDKHEFLFDKKSNVVEQAKDDIRRLFSAGLIARKPERGFRTLFDQGSDVQDINKHFYITEQGKEYLTFLKDKHDWT